MYNGILNYSFCSNNPNAVLTRFEKRVYTQYLCIPFNKTNVDLILDDQEKTFVNALLSSDDIVKVLAHMDEVIMEKKPEANWETVLNHVGYSYILLFKSESLLKLNIPKSNH